MPKLTSERFHEFFQALWGPDCAPFAWQMDLASRVLHEVENPWPEVIALPTGSGKTACLDIAIYALAVRAGLSNPAQRNIAPRRVFFVVDRRVIVDEAFERARKLASKLHAAQDGILREVADSLRRIGGADTPLSCFQLRGGMYRSDAWAKNPTQPIIVASTVDQLGSRLLFRAYGNSFKAWPIQAGLACNDALILLDEAHCAVPFMETLKAIRKFRTWAEQPLITPFHATIMSATPPIGVNDIFRDISEEPRMLDHPLGARQMANKPTFLIEMKASGTDTQEELAKELAKAAEDLAGDKNVAVVVFANRVATARLAYHFLAAKYKERVTLLTGRMRPLDKDDAVSEKLSVLSADVSRARQLVAPLFVVATQTLEVGANLDFDVLVTECASLDALRQRFGRLNRMGRKIESVAAILVRKDQIKNSDDDPVYGAALANTWKWLNKNTDKNGAIDMGISSLAERLPGEEEMETLNAPVGHAPVMLPAHIDSWVQTAPEPVPTPDISMFLHGPGRTSADVQVCWRADIDMDFPESALEALTICPPAMSECLAVPIRLIRRWLTGEEFSGTISDVEGVIEGQDGESPRKSRITFRRVVQWRGRDEARMISDANELRPGDVIIIPSSLGGWESLGDLPQTNGGVPVLDWGERAYAVKRGKALLRLCRSVIQQWPEFNTKSSLLELASQSRALFEDDPESLIAALSEVLNAVIKDKSIPQSFLIIKLIAESLLHDPGLKRRIVPHPSGNGVVLRGTQRLFVSVEDSLSLGTDLEGFSDEDDSSASGTVDISLPSHLEGVAEVARRFARCCGLPDNLIEVLFLAGLLHDLGKADPRFQILLHGGNPWARGELLAKSEDMPQGPSAYWKACKRAGYPLGGRHELISTRLAESASDLLPEDQQLRELVLQLVASHHGYCRPFAPVTIDEKPALVKISLKGCELETLSSTGLELLDSGVPERFWRLIRRYGWWGLAWLESILRLADHRRSEWEETNS